MTCNENKWSKSKLNESSILCTCIRVYHCIMFTNIAKPLNMQTALNYEHRFKVWLNHRIIVELCYWRVDIFDHIPFVDCRRFLKLLAQEYADSKNKTSFLVYLFCQPSVGQFCSQLFNLRGCLSKVAWSLIYFVHIAFFIIKSRGYGSMIIALMTIVSRADVVIVINYYIINK